MRLFEVNGSNQFYHVTKSVNVQSILRKGLIPQTGERSAKLDDHGVYLFNHKTTLEDALMNWLGDEFDEDEKLTVLLVNLPKDFPISAHDVVGYEWVTQEHIHPKYIKVGWTE